MGEMEKCSVFRFGCSGSGEFEEKDGFTTEM
jgi:hypothetical protein